MSYNTREELAEAVVDNGGVKTFSMQEVRNACGYDRLRSNVVDQISRKLRGVGLRHIPRKLPEDQNRDVRLYIEDSIFGQLVDAALNPGQENDKKLKSMLDIFNNGAAAKVMKARTLAGDLLSKIEALQNELEE